MADTSSEFQRESVLLRHSKRQTASRMNSAVVAVFLFASVVSVQSTLPASYDNGITGIPNADYAGYDGLPGLLNSFRRRCPLCDSSVYSYCTDKLFHDSCCCHNPNNPYDRVPYQCQFADCSFLHANSCQEHKLITACCCISHIYKK